MEIYLFAKVGIQEEPQFGIEKNLSFIKMLYTVSDSKKVLMLDL